MGRFDSYLRKNLGWYDDWHATRYHHVYHWSALLILAIFVTSVILWSEFGPRPEPLDSSAATTNVVLYASDVAKLVGNWSKVSDPAAAGGVRLYNPNANAAKINPAQTNPTNYFEATFNAEAGAYHVWLRLKADDDSWANDAVFVQFSDSVDVNGNESYRIGTVNSLTVQLEEGRNAGVQNWGWNDNDWGALGPHVYFAQTGTRTIRVQQREDGVSIDQIVLSPAQYLTSAPGALKNDSTIVAKPTPPPPPPPEPTPPPSTSLSSQDIGSVAIAGSLSVANGVYTITASGTDIWANADGFRYSYQPLSGDGTLVARVVSAVQTDDFTLAGVMIRESLTADSSHASMLVTPNGRAKFRYRAATGGSTASYGPGVGAITLPRWVKVTRQGNTFIGSISADGSNWQQIESGTVAMGATVYAGIAVTSHKNSVLTTAVVDSYTLNAATASPPPPSVPSIPSAIAPSEVTSTGFKANWVASAGATGYRLDVATDPSFVNYVPGYQNRDVGNVLSHGLTGLTPSTTYVYRLRAYNTSGTSGNSNNITIATTAAPAPPPTATCPTTIPTGAFLGCYYDNIDFTGSVVVKNPDSYPINYDWAGGAPSSSMGADQYSARFIGNFSFEAGDYTFTTTADDGVRVYVDNQLIIDKWINQAATTYTAVKSLTAGNHQVKMEYFEDGGAATAKLSWTKNAAAPPPPPPAPTGATQLKVLHWNAFQGSQTDNGNNFDSIAGWIANLNPHVVSINETYANHATEYKNRIAQRTGVTWYAHFVQAQTDGVGNLILSRLPFVSINSRQLENYNPEFPAYRRNILQATVNLGGKNINFFSTHLDHNNSTIRSLQIDELKTYLSGFAEPRIVAGDFNANPGTAEMNKMALTYTDAWAAARANLSDALISTSYACNEEGRTRSSILDYQFYSKTATNVTLKEARVVDTRDFGTTRAQVQVFLNPSTNCDNDHVRPSDHNALLNTYEIQ